MNASAVTRRTADQSLMLRQLVGVLTLVEGMSFAFMSVLHTGVFIPLGFSEPVIVPAVIVEGLCGAVLVMASFGLLTSRPWGWIGAVIAQAFSLAGVLLGIVAINAGRGPHSELNDTYHGIMVVALALGLGALWVPSIRRALRAKPGLLR
jgi:hypothetical protein